MAMIFAYQQLNLNKGSFLCTVTKFRQKTKGCILLHISQENRGNWDGGVSDNIKPQTSLLEMQVGRVIFLWMQSLLICKVKHKISVNILGREEKQRQKKY